MDRHARFQAFRRYFLYNDGPSLRLR
jgi:hypothetical protein